MLRTVAPDAPLFWTFGEMAARQCPGFRSYVTIEYSEIWAIVGIAFDGRFAPAALRCQCAGLRGPRGSLAIGFNRRRRQQHEQQITLGIFVAVFARDFKTE